MDDIKVYEQVDSVLEELLTETTAPECYSQFQESLAQPEYKIILNHFEIFMRKYLETLGYTYLSKLETQKNTFIFLINGQQKTFEFGFRSDHLIKVETAKDGVVGGIHESKSDFFVVVFADTHEMWRIRTSELRKLITDNNNIFKQSFDYLLLDRELSSVKGAFTIRKLGNEFLPTSISS